MTIINYILEYEIYYMIYIYGMYNIIVISFYIYISYIHDIGLQWVKMDRVSQVHVVKTLPKTGFESVWRGNWGSRIPILDC
jgi:hypothetical protein